MKKILLVIAVLSAFAACKKTIDQKKPVKSSYKYTVGISKIISHPALDRIEQGIKDELHHQGFDDIFFDIQNANGDFSTATSIANKFRKDRVNVAVGIATPTAVALANQISDIPVVFSGVTDPYAASLAGENSAGNITGVSNMAPIKEQLNIVLKMKQVARLGYIYTPSEANSISQLEELKEMCDNLGIKLVASTVSNTSEVKQAAEIIAPKVDFIFVSNDNTVVAALNSLTESAAKYNVPVFSTDPSSAEEAQVTIAYGVDDYLTGRATGKMIADILRNEDIKNIPVKFMNQPDDLAKYLNMVQINKYNMTIPDELL